MQCSHHCATQEHSTVTTINSVVTSHPDHPISSPEPPLLMSSGWTYRDSRRCTKGSGALRTRLPCHPDVYQSRSRVEVTALGALLGKCSSHLVMNELTVNKLFYYLAYLRPGLLPDFVHTETFRASFSGATNDNFWKISVRKTI